jgi:Kdo2-lipid IVA lauroyltransferase/acyltransferase
MTKAVWAIQAAAFYCFTLLAALVPASATYRLGGLAGLLIPYIAPRRRAIVLDNISAALPFMNAHPLWDSPYADAEELSRETFKNLGRSLMEICRLYHGRGEDAIANLELRGRENYDSARAKGKGVICFSGHCGNWELMALAFGSLFGDGVVVARRQDNPFLNRMVARMRMRYKSGVVYKQGALRGILMALRKGNQVGFLADQAVMPEEGALIDMMGRTAWASKAPVIIAQKSGAPLVPVFIHREGKRQVITFYPEHQFSGDKSEEGVRKEAQALSRYVEDFVVAHPTQWYWVHRRWKRAGEITPRAEERRADLHD